jgi:hypothetical protein
MLSLISANVESASALAEARCEKSFRGRLILVGVSMESVCAFIGRESSISTSDVPSSIIIESVAVCGSAPTCVSWFMAAGDRPIAKKANVRWVKSKSRRLVSRLVILFQKRIREARVLLQRI